MSEASDEEKAKLLHQGAGNYSNLCGVLAGFVSVILVLVLTPGYFSLAIVNIFFELIVIFFAVTIFGFLVTALGFINISSSSLQDYGSLREMKRQYAFNQALVHLFINVFLAGVVVLVFSMGALIMTIVVAVGLILSVTTQLKDWWALARRVPSQKERIKKE